MLTRYIEIHTPDGGLSRVKAIQSSTGEKFSLEDGVAVTYNGKCFYKHNKEFAGERVENEIVTMPVAIAVNKVLITLPHKDLEGYEVTYRAISPLNVKYEFYYYIADGKSFFRKTKQYESIGLVPLLEWNKLKIRNVPMPDTKKFTEPEPFENEV